MINPFADVDWTPNLAARRKFGRSLLIGFPVVAVLGLAGTWLASGVWRIDLFLWIGGIGAATGAVLSIAPAIALPFYVAWYGLACSVGFVISNALLALSYYAVLVPIGVARRLLGRRSLDRTIDRGAATYWRKAPPRPDPAKYLRQF